MELACPACGARTRVATHKGAGRPKKLTCARCHQPLVREDLGLGGEEEAPDFELKPLHGGTVGSAGDRDFAFDAEPAAAQSAAAHFAGGEDRPQGPRERRISERVKAARHHDESAADDPQAARPRARLGLFLGVALVAVIGSGVVVGVVRSKRLHVEPQVQLPVHVVRAPDPIAQEAFKRGLVALLDDTTSGYLAAARAFDAAIARDQEFTDAWAGAALAATFLALDSQSSAAQMRQTLEERVAEMLLRRKAEAAPNEGTETASAAEAALVRTLLAKAQEASAQERQAVTSLRHAAAILLQGEHLTAQTPLMAAAVAVWYASASDDPTVRALVEPQLATADMLADGSLVPESDAGSMPSAAANDADGRSPPPDAYAAWHALARAQMLAATPKLPPEKVAAAYEAALGIEPGLRRARWELAALELRRGKVAQARALLADLAHGDPPHEKARALLQSMGDAQTATPLPLPANMPLPASAPRPTLAPSSGGNSAQPGEP